MKPAKLSKAEYATKLLKKNGFKVERLDKNKFIVSTKNWEEPYNEKGLIKFAKEFTHNNKQKTRIKKNLKKESKKERGFVRDKLNKNDDDVKFPKQFFSDIWSWD